MGILGYIGRRMREAQDLGEDRPYLYEKPKDREFYNSRGQWEKYKKKMI